MLEAESTTHTYCCPGESHAISRAVHLGRLARFYPACRSCPLADDTGSLSPKHVARLIETRHRAPAVKLFDGEGVRGIAATEITAAVVRRIAGSFGCWLTCSNTPTLASVVIAHDGRPLTAEFVEAAAEGLRLAGCDVIDIGAALEGCFTAALHSLAASGGLLIGNVSNTNGAGAGPHGISIRFWREGGKPLSDDAIDELQERLEHEVAASSSRFGTLQRRLVEADYLASLRPYFHALRPLRIQLNCGSPALWRYLEQLTGEVACEFLSRDNATATSIDFTVTIDGDGHAWRIDDEQGRPIASHALLAIVADFLLRDEAGAAVIVEHDAPLETDAWITRCGGRPVRTNPSRAAMDRALRQHAAILGGGPTGRIWFGGDSPTVDALRALAILLTRLSESDQPLSAVCSPSILAPS